MGQLRRQGKHNQARRAEDEGPDHVKAQVDAGRPLCRSGSADTGDEGGDAGADILAQGDVDGRVGGHNAVHGQRLENSHGSGGALQQGRHNQPDEHTQHGVAAEKGEGPGKNGRSRVGGYGGRHKVQTHKQKAEAHQDLSRLLSSLFFGKDDEQGAYADEKGGIKLRLHGLKSVPQLAHGHNPRRDGGSDVGAHDHAHRLGKAHDPGAHKTHHHHRGGSAALNNSGDQRPQHDAHHPVVGEHPQELLHFPAGRFLHAVRHNVHAVKEHAQASGKGKKIGNIADRHKVLLRSHSLQPEAICCPATAVIFTFF